MLSGALENAVRCLLENGNNEFAWSRVLHFSFFFSFVLLSQLYPVEFHGERGSKATNTILTLLMAWKTLTCCVAIRYAPSSRLSLQSTELIDSAEATTVSNILSHKYSEAT